MNKLYCYFSQLIFFLLEPIHAQLSGNLLLVLADDNKGKASSAQIKCLLNYIIITSNTTPTKSRCYNAEGQIVIQGNQSIQLQRQNYPPGFYFALMEEAGSASRSIKIVLN